MTVKGFKTRLKNLLLVASLSVCAATFTGFLGQLGWLLELTSHFRVQYLAFLMLAACFFVGLGKPKIALICSAAAIVNLSQILPFYVSEVEAAEEQTHLSVRAFLLNVHSRNTDYARAIQAIHDTQPHVVVLLEVTSRWWLKLQQLDEVYPYSFGVPREDNFGIAVFSKLPLLNADVVYVGTAQHPSVVAEVETGSTLVTLFGTHPPAPMDPKQARQRNEQLQGIARFLKTKTTPVLLLGDLNISPWSYYFGQFLAQSGLRDSARGRGVSPTWPTGFWPLQIPIDHCLISQSIRIRQRRVGPDVGSDHYPLSVEFTVVP